MAGDSEPDSKLDDSIASRGRKRDAAPRGWCMWAEEKFGIPGLRVRLGKRAFGRVRERWFSTEKEALQWVAAEKKRVNLIGRTAWMPEREQLLEFEAVIRSREEVAAEELKLTPLLDLVRKDIREARRMKKIGLITLSHTVGAWKQAKLKKSGQHQQKCAMVYDRFAEWFGGERRISSVSAEDAERWSKSLQVGENTRTRYVGRLASLWRWAEKPQRRWVTENPWLVVETEPLKHKRPAILTVEQVASLLRTAAAEPSCPLLVFLTLALFAGPRVAEARRLDWKAICLEPGEEGIELDPEQTKTGSRRWVPLPPVAVAWLTYYSGPREGPISPSSWNFRRERLLARAGFRVKAVVSGKSKKPVSPLEGEARWDWPRNGLRHSYCSYAVAHLRDLAEVAFRAGNSVQVLRRDYVGVVRTKNARAYFALDPVLVTGGPSRKHGTEESGSVL